ncbi:hypothetical protein AAVH_27010 [Aphelenchoides avenae]|nr:hypothetical protein AAVH_27010 [Aphelenchus avenae]
MGTVRVCNRQHKFPQLTLQQCISDYKKLFKGNERLNGMVNGSIPISTFERLFFALWAARYHLLPRRTPNNHFEVRRPNEHTFLGDLLHPSNRELPFLFSSAFDDVTVGTPNPHFKVGDLRIALLRWYESCPASREYLNDHVSGPASIELSFELYRADIRTLLRDLFREHFADALDVLRMRIYNFAPTERFGNALTIIHGGSADRVVEKLKKYILGHRVQNVYFFWGRDGLSDSSHDITAAWYSKLTEHVVRWFPHTRLFILTTSYTRENDRYRSHHIKRGVLANLQDHCLNTSVICDPMDLKLHDYHERWMLRDGGIQFG